MLAVPLLLLAAIASAEGRRTQQQAGSRPVDRHVGRWTAAPTLVPGTSQQPDGPLGGNGDFGFVIGGGRECCGGHCCANGGGASVADGDLNFFYGKNDFWVNGPVVQTQGIGEPWTHATPGFVSVSVAEPPSPPSPPSPPAPPGTLVTVCSAANKGALCIDRYHHDGQTPGPDEINLNRATGPTTWMDEVWKFNGTMVSSCTNPSCTEQCVGTRTSGNGSSSTIGMVDCKSSHALTLLPELTTGETANVHVIRRWAHGTKTSECLAINSCSLPADKPGILTLLPCAGGGDPSCPVRSNLQWLITSVAHAPPPPAPSLPFVATQELANGRCNASTGLGPGGTTTLHSSSFVQIGTSLAVHHLRIESDSVPANAAPSAVAVNVTLSTPNLWNVPVRSGQDSDVMWLSKDTTNTVHNSLTLTACSSEMLFYNSLRDVKVLEDSQLVVVNSSSHVHLCLNHQPASGQHPPYAAMGPQDEWIASTADCEGTAPWKLSGTRLTDGKNCARYFVPPDNGNVQWQLKVISAPCSSTLGPSMHDSWTLYHSSDGKTRLKASAAAFPLSNYIDGACLTTPMDDNVNNSVVLAVKLLDSSGKAVPGSVDCRTTSNSNSVGGTGCSGGCISQACVLSVELIPENDYHLLVAAATNRDLDWAGDPLRAALQTLKSADLEAAALHTNAFWQDYWSKSSIDIFSDYPAIEAWYFGMLYFIGASYRPDGIATSHCESAVVQAYHDLELSIYGVWNTHDDPQCHGQLTLDYNTAAVVFGLGSANRLERMKPIVDTLGRRDIFELGKRRAAQRHWSLANRSSIGAIAPYGTQSSEYGCESGGYDHEHGCPESFGDFEGIEFPCAMGPFWRNANNFDCAVRFNAGLSTTMLIDWFEFTQDRAFFNETLMPFLTGVADFYHSYALRSSNSSSGPLQLQRTCAQEMCQQRQAGTGGGGQTPAEDNSLSDLAYARMVIQKLRQYQNISGQPLKQSWVELENRLVDFPLVERAGFGTGWAEATMNGQPVSVRGALGNNDYPIVYFSPIHPAQIVGLESPPAVLDAARNTLWAVNAMNKWHPNNGFCLGWPSAGRIMGRANGSKVLNAMTEAIKDACFPNFWPNLGGGGLEQAGGIEAINSLMLQSHESCVRVFPGWPDNNTAASFQSLRARRGFVVSASQLNGKVQSPISIASELGLPLSICLPPGWTNASVLSSDSKLVPMSLMDAEMRRWLVQTEPNATYSLVRLH